MKNSISLRAAAFIIALVIATGLLAGCAKTGNGDGTSDTASTAATTAPEETTAPADTTPTALSVLGEKDFGGETRYLLLPLLRRTVEVRPYRDRG